MRGDAIYFGGGLFGWFHEPAAAHRSVAVAICNPIGDDIIRAHRPLRHLSEELAAAGFAVLRFDFHGTGDSEGDERAPGCVARWRRDLATAIDELRARTGATQVSVVGMRLGATLAAEVAATRSDVRSVALWHPFVDGPAFVTETIKMHTMHKLLEPASFTSGPATYDTGSEALGFFLTNQTIEDLKSVDLMKLAKRPAPDMLTIAGGSTPSSKLLLDRLRGLDVKLTDRHLPGHRFLISVPHKSTVPTEIIGTIVRWLDETHPERTDAALPTAAAAKASGGDEAVRFGSLFGILTRPARVDPSRPAVIMMNAGTIHRIGPHRLYVTMARELAALGFTTLRMDLSGIGDSPVVAGQEENLCYPATGLPDCQQAMAFLESTTGAHRFILAGLCSGGDIAFQLGITDRRVAGVVMLNPRTFLVHDLAMVDAYKQAIHDEESLVDKGKRLITGHVDLRSVAERAVRTLLDRARPHKHDETTDVPACLRLMAERGVDTFLVSTVHDPGIEYVDAHFGGAMKALVSLESFRRDDVPGTDHTFTSVWAQQHVCQTVREHLVKRHGAAR